ncbi:MAG: hypothetical protein HN842_06265 [Gammaproteobacteria bacterium]|nr:hypothetical protein [Gammaproteobacteria bacterium]MBT7307802.1 hypothetical protein [Gammaproteobacteria bacterium]
MSNPTNEPVKSTIRWGTLLTILALALSPISIDYQGAIYLTTAMADDDGDRDDDDDSGDDDNDRDEPHNEIDDDDNDSDEHQTSGHQEYDDDDSEESSDHSTDDSASHTEVESHHDSSHTDTETDTDHDVDTDEEFTTLSISTGQATYNPATASIHVPALDYESLFGTTVYSFDMQQEILGNSSSFVINQRSIRLQDDTVTAAHSTLSNGVLTIPAVEVPTVAGTIIYWLSMQNSATAPYSFELVNYGIIE